MPPMIPGPALEAGIRSEFLDTYTTAMADRTWLPRVVRELGSDRRVNRFAIPEAFGRPFRWDADTEITEDSVRYIVSEMVIHRWGIRVEWREEDKEDDQTGTLLAVARSAGTGFPNLQERGVYQFLRGSTDPTLFPTVPNAADGVPLFSATDANGNNRFQIAGGNIEPGLGTTADAIRQVILRCRARFKRMRNNRGDPNNDPGKLNNLLFFYGSHLEENVFEAFFQTRPGQVVQIGGGPFMTGIGNPGTNAAAVSNILQDAGMVPIPVSTPYLDDTDDFFVCALDLPKSIASITRRGQREFFANLANSDRARKLGREAVQFDLRWGLGIPGIPFDWIGVDNTPSGFA